MTWQRAALLLSLVFLAREALLVGLTPPFHAPDEQAHFDSVQALADSRALPVLRPDCIGAARYSPEINAAIGGLLNGVIFHPEKPLPPLSGLAIPTGPGSRATDGCNYVAIYPPAYYASAAAAVSLMPGATLFRRIAAARAVSVLWGLLAVWGAFGCGVLLFSGGVRQGLLLGLCVALQPMLGFLFASVNSDAGVLACACLAAACIAWRTRDPGPRPLLALALVCALGVLCKPTFTLVLPWAGLLALLAGPRTLAGAAVCAASLAPAGLAHLCWMRHLGGVADGRLTAAARELPVADFLASNVFSLERWNVLLAGQLWLSWGWLDVVLRPGWYAAVRALLALSLLGLVLGWRGLPANQRVTAACAALCGAGFAGSLLVLEYRLMRAGEGGLLSGRYFLGLWPLFALALLSGLRALGERARLRLDLAALLPLLLVLLDAAAVQRCANRYSVRGQALAHAQEVFELFAPGWFWPAAGLQVLALAAAAWLALRLLVEAR